MGTWQVKMFPACRYLGYDVNMGAKPLEVKPIDSAVASVIKNLQNQAGYTLRELSRVSGVPISRLSRCVRLERPFQLNEVVLIAEAFNLKTSSLVGEAEKLLLLPEPEPEPAPADATQSDYELVAKPLSPDTAAAVEYWDNLGEDPQ